MGERLGNAELRMKNEENSEFGIQRDVHCIRGDVGNYELRMKNEDNSEFGIQNSERR